MVDFDLVCAEVEEDRGVREPFVRVQIPGQPDAAQGVATQGGQAAAVCGGDSGVAVEPPGPVVRDAEAGHVSIVPAVGPGDRMGVRGCR